ncbi:hypothetical protein Tco_0456767 [Tanacetum coccineum]
MSTLAEFMIVAGADNRPPMLDKPMYESWKSRMKLYIQEDGTVRLKTSEELSHKEEIVISMLQTLFFKVFHQMFILSSIITKLPKRYETELSYLCKAHHCQSKNVSLARDLHTSNYDQLYAYLEQQEAYANEARLMRERFPNPLALVANYHQPPSHFNNYHSQYTTLQYQQQFSPLTQHTYSIR